MTSLEQACRDARGEPAPWNAARAEAAWEGIVPLHRKRKRRRAATRVALAAAVLATLGSAYAVATRPQPSRPLDLVASLHLPEPVDPGLAPIKPSHLEPPQPQPQPSTALLDDAVVQHEGGRKTYRGERDWTGSVQAAGDVEVTGEGSTFVIESDPHATTVTAHTAEVIVRYGGQRVELGPEESVRIEVTRSVKPKNITSRAPSADDLLSQADRARKSGNLAEAAEALSRFTQRHPSHADAGTAWFQLGKVERRRGRHAAAAKAFARSRKALRGGVLEMDALAEEAKSLSAAGKHRDAAARARTYLDRDPDGLHAGSMAAIAKVK